MIIGIEVDAVDVAALDDLAGIDERAAPGLRDRRVVRRERPRLLLPVGEHAGQQVEARERRRAHEKDP